MSDSTTFSGPFAAGQLLTVSVSCSSGKVVLGGGARVTTSGLLEQLAALRSTYPSAADTWTSVAVVTGASLTGSVTVTSYALCSL